MIGGLLSGVTNLLGIGGADDAPQIQFNPWNVNTSWGQASFEDGTANLGLSPELQSLVQGLLGQGQNYLQQAQNPQATMGFLSNMFKPQFENQQLSQESRLYNQGLLGSTTGSLQQQALRGAQNNTLAQATMGAQQQLFNQGQGLLGQFMNFQQMPLQLAALGGQLGGQQMNADSFNAQAQAQYDQMQADFWNTLISGGASALTAGMSGGAGGGAAGAGPVFSSPVGASGTGSLAGSGHWYGPGGVGG